MTSILYRTASSTVVLLKDDSVFEVRRGDLRGSAIPDRRTWESQGAWLTAVGEPLIPPTPYSEDLRLVISLWRKHVLPGTARLCVHKAAGLDALEGQLEGVSEAYDYTKRVKAKANGLYEFPNNYYDLAVGKQSINPRGAKYISQQELVDCAEKLSTRLASLTAQVKDRKGQWRADMMAGRFKGKFTPCGNTTLYVACSDGSIRPLYYNARHNVFGVAGTEGGFVVGRTFADLGITPTAWYKKNWLTYALMPIKDVSYRWHLLPATE